MKPTRVKAGLSAPYSVPQAPPPMPPLHKFSMRPPQSKGTVARTDLSRSSFYERQNLKSRCFDKTFPSPVQIASQVSLATERTISMHGLHHSHRKNDEPISTVFGTSSPARMTERQLSPNAC